jgi:hypothetical protein
MHSRIFKVYIPEKEELNDKKKIEENISELIGLNIEEDIMGLSSINGMDWFDYRGNEQFKEDVEWLIEAYLYQYENGYKIDKKNFIKVDGKPVYVLKEREFEKVRDTIKNRLDKRIEEVKKMFKSKNKNALWFYSAARTLYPHDGFWFYIPGYGLVNEVEFYFAIKDADMLYIVKSYDYHY